MSKGRQQRSLHDRVDRSIHPLENLGFVAGFKRNGLITNMIEMIAIAEEKKECKDHNQKIGHKQQCVLGKIGALCKQKSTEHFPAFKNERFELAAIG